MKRIKIEFVYDVVCSWCPIGHANLNAALKELEGMLRADIFYLPFELNPNMPPEGERIDAHLRRRNSWNAEQFARYRDDVVAKAKSAGLTYDYSKRTHYYNTSKAHRLIDFAEQFGQQSDIVNALTEQYFQNGENISDTETLSELATSIGFDREDVKRNLTSSSRSPSLEAKYDLVKSLGIKRIPTLIIDVATAVQGSNSVEFYKQFLSSLADRDEHQLLAK